MVAADLQPRAGACREVFERGLVAPLEHRPAPVPGQVPDALRGGESPGGQGLGLSVGAARDDDLAVLAEVPADRVAQRGVAG